MQYPGSDNVPRVSIVGNCSVDFVLKLPTMPAVGDRVEAEEYLVRVAGGGLNTAVSAHNLGAKANVIARVGDDYFGKLIIRYLVQVGININCIAIDNSRPTGMAVVILSEEPNRTVLVASNANSALSVNDIDVSKEALCRSQVIVVRLTVTPMVAQKALQIARENNIKSIIVPTSVKHLEKYMEALFLGTDLLLMNEIEASCLIGSPLSNSPAECAEAILRRFDCRNVVITLGSRGAVSASHDRITEYIQGLSVAAVDTTGAGEAFCGAFARYWASQEDLGKVLRYANIAAAISVTRSGQHKFPGNNEVEGFQVRNGI